MPFLIIFIVIPLIELGIFSEVSEHIGLGSALLFSLFTAILGGTLVRMQGIQTISSVRSSVETGKMPMNELFDGFCLVAAGALLITPGFMTDTVGFLLLVPQFRAFLRGRIKNNTQFSMHGMGNAQGFQRGGPNDPDIIEGEYEDLDTQEPDNDNSKPRLP